MASIMHRLKESTQPLHDHAESRPLEKELAAGRTTEAAYVDLLGQRLRIHTTLEAAVRHLCAARADVTAVVTDDLFQEPNLRADLSHFNVNPDAIEPLAATRQLCRAIETALKSETPMALLGFYYVFEGSKNGARFVAKRVGPALGLKPPHGLRYFDPHGSEQRPKWLAFKERMDQLALTDAERDAIVQAACRTFELAAELDDQIHQRHAGGGVVGAQGN